MPSNKNIFYIKIANRVIKIQALYDRCRLLCKDYLLPDDTKMQVDIVVDIVPRNILLENDGLQNQEYFDGKEKYLYYDPGYLEQFAIHRKLCDAMPAFNTILMHGAVVELKNQGYMFTAPSGTGKTTRARLWCQEYPDTRIINGDKPFLQIREQEVYAYGSPWCGKEHWNTNDLVKLRTIFIIEREDLDNQISIEKIEARDAFDYFLNQVYWPRDPVARKQTVKLVKALTDNVTVFRFRSAPTQDAIRMAYAAAKQG